VGRDVVRTLAVLEVLNRARRREGEGSDCPPVRGAADRLRGVLARATLLLQGSRAHPGRDAADGGGFGRDRPARNGGADREADSLLFERVGGDAGGGSAPAGASLSEVELERGRVAPRRSTAARRRRCAVGQRVERARGAPPGGRGLSALAGCRAPSRCAGLTGSGRGRVGLAGRRGGDGAGGPRRRGDARVRRRRRALGARRWSDAPRGDGAPAGLRRGGGPDRRAGRAPAYCRETNADDSARATARSAKPRRRLPVSRLQPQAVPARAPHPALGARRADDAGEPGAAVLVPPSPRT
jgi:hypothetical protein